MIDNHELDSDALDRIDSDALLDVLGIDLSSAEDDASHDADWIDIAGQHWVLTGHAFQIGSRVVLWTTSDEAGVDDVLVTDPGGYRYLEDQAREHAEEIAAGIGRLCDVERGEHYTRQGVQYQHQADGEHDRDGFRVILTPRRPRVL